MKLHRVGCAMKKLKKFDSMDDNKKALKGSVFDWGWDAESVGKVYFFVMCDVFVCTF